MFCSQYLLACEGTEDKVNCSVAPCINIIQVAEISPKNSQQKSGKSAYFLARAKAKSHDTGRDNEDKIFGKECNKYCIVL